MHHSSRSTSPSLSAIRMFLALVLFMGSFSMVFARRYPCDDLLVRKEWRNMFPNEKQAYVKAVQCMQSNPAVGPAYPQAKTRFDEFQAHYMKQADSFLNLGQFLPWHRHFIRTYEKALRQECGYTGANPYWDWSQDADSNKSISTSPIFDPTTGFGGDGVKGTYMLPFPSSSPSSSNTASANFLASNKLQPTTFHGCVRTGPFANYTLNVGPGRVATRHCLTRGLASDVVGSSASISGNTQNPGEGVRKALGSATVAEVVKLADYEAFRKEVEGGDKVKMFEAGQALVGGEMGNVYSSAGDPLFYLHLANIDRIWWTWQQLSPATRFFDISGPATHTPPIARVGVDYVLNMGTLGLSVPIRDTLDLWSKPNCYTYL